LACSPIVVAIFPLACLISATAWETQNQSVAILLFCLVKVTFDVASPKPRPVTESSRFAWSSSTWRQRQRQYQQRQQQYQRQLRKGRDATLPVPQRANPQQSKGQDDPTFVAAALRDLTCLASSSAKATSTLALCFFAVLVSHPEIFVAILSSSGLPPLRAKLDRTSNSPCASCIK
jgi:hypothetical protein